MAGNNSRGNRGPYDVLLVESEPDEAATFIDSFEATDATEAVHVVSDGTEALDFVHQRGAHADATRPDLILLDLHIQGSSGTEILSELNEEPGLRRIPVIVLTTSEAAEDVAQSYQLNANAYVQKPTSSEEFVQLAQAIEDFWLTVAHLPPK